MLANKNVGDTQMLLKILLAGVLGIALVFGVGACGKRGDPYRPSSCHHAVGDWRERRLRASTQAEQHRRSMLLMFIRVRRTFAPTAGNWRESGMVCDL